MRRVKMIATHRPLNPVASGDEARFATVRMESEQRLAMMIRVRRHQQNQKSYCSLSSIVVKRSAWAMQSRSMKFMETVR